MHSTKLKHLRKVLGAQETDSKAGLNSPTHLTEILAISGVAVDHPTLL